MGSVGIYAGTFDPVHDGHVAFALAATRRENLEKVVMLPERKPRNKTQVTPFDDRLAMLKLAVQKHPLLEVVEFQEEQFDITTTLPALQQRYGRDLSLLVGADVVKTLHLWPDMEKLVRQAAFIVALRQNDSRDEITKALVQIGARFVCFSSPNKQVASSSIRQKGHKKHLDPKVQEYIAVKQLYPLAFGAN